MLFNSLNFGAFFAIVLTIYWLVLRRHRHGQNLFLLFASYVFYAWWDWRFLSLILISSAVDFVVGRKIYGHSEPTSRKLWLSVSLGVNLGILGFFKYFEFFVESFVAAFKTVGIELNQPSLEIILPVGISFYTFQTLSYTIDIYRRKLEPTDDLVSFFAFVSFFPQLVAGPIERARRLLPQFQAQRTLTYGEARDAVLQILWGLFKKIVVADNCAYVVDVIFANGEDMNGSAMWIGAIFFAFQIYADFSGYSDMAIGLARLLGIRLSQNFDTPYFSRNIGEFWRRWHISLSTWFRDYVFIPLGGSRVRFRRHFFNILVTFTLSGFWHGANWTFIVWGFLNGLYYLPGMLLDRFSGSDRSSKTKEVDRTYLVPGPLEVFQIGVTFAATCIAWVFFRAENVSGAASYVALMLSPSALTSPQGSLAGLGLRDTMLYAAVGIITMLVLEWCQRGKQHPLQFSPDRHAAVRWGSYITVIVMLLVLRHTGDSLDFIYFQF